MQLEAEKKRSPLRDALHTAAMALLLVPASAHADDSGDRVDFSTLFYGEQGRTQVVEPMVQFTHLMSGQQSISARFGIDVITGASPTGALPSGEVQTRTTPSGRTVTSRAGEVPMTSFQDRRFVLDAEYKRAVGRFASTALGGHFSTEKDYRSVGVNGKVSIDLMRRLLTVTVGGGVNRDRVSPTGGTPDGLSDGLTLRSGSNPKDVNSLLFGVSRVMSRSWLLSVTGTQTNEKGYLTEPYKLISLTDPVTGRPVGELTDKRPSTRDRSSILLSSVNHLTDDVLYASYRYYSDSWSVRSHTIDLKYRHDLSPDQYVEPLVRYYTQSAASFYTTGLDQGAPLPDFATADYRLGPLQTATLGATFGFHLYDRPGQWTLRAEYIRQSADSSPPLGGGENEKESGSVGSFNSSPAINIYALVLGYSFGK